MFAERGETLVCRLAKIAEKLKVNRRFRHEAHRGGGRAYSETMMNKLTERIQRAASRCSMAAGSGTNIHEGLRGACGTDVRQDASAEESTDARIRASRRKLVQLRRTMHEFDAEEGQFRSIPSPSRRIMRRKNRAHNADTA